MVHTLQTILEDLLSASNGKGFVFDDGRNEPVTVPFTVLSQEVSRLGRQMLTRGIEPKQRVAIILEDNREFVTAFLGAVIEGVIPVPIYPPPKIGNHIQHLENACRIMVTGQVSHLICNTGTQENLSHLEAFQQSKIRTHTFSSITKAKLSEVSRIRARPEDTCFLQFTSGSTSSPKGVVISHSNVLENTRAIVHDGLRAKPETDLGVSWLPLYHDMGLIGFVIAPVVGRIPVVLAPTFSFIRRPGLWMKLVDKYKATITFGPNFAFSLSRKRAQRIVDQGIRLDHLRVLGCGAEPINAQNMRDFISAFRPAGLNPSAITPSYGMAEACLAVAFEPLDEEIYSIYVDRHCLSEGDQIKLVDATNNNAEEIVATGRCIKDHKLYIQDEKGLSMEDGYVGEIVFEGPSVAHGYFDNEESTSQVFTRNQLRTQDIGFIVNGRLFICGRKKDLIIINGRNYYPEALEEALNKTSGIREGATVCFSVAAENSEQLIVISEHPQIDNDELKKNITHVLSKSYGLKIHDIKLVKPGTLPKTSSGKKQRQKTKEMYLNNTI